MKKNFGRRYAVKDMLNRIVFNYLYARQRKFPWKGVEVSVLYRADRGVSAELLLKGLHEAEELETFFDFIKKNFRVNYQSFALDVGANIGNHSVYLSEKFKHVLAFEPNTENHEICSINTRKKKNIVLHQFGLSDRNMVMPMSFDQRNPGAAHVRKNPLEADGCACFKRLDDLGLDGPISFIKIDVEGHEFQVLRGGEGVILRDQPIIVFEQHASDFDGGGSRTIACLRSLGYRDFYTIQRVVRDRIKSPIKLVRRLWSLWVHLRWLSEGLVYSVTKMDSFERKFYNFIFAVPPGISSRSPSGE